MSDVQNAAVDPFSLQDKRVLVVGGTRGIGRAIALRCARAGAHVVATYIRNEESSETLKAEAAASGLRLETLRADATMDKARELLVQSIGEKFSDISAIVFAAATGVHRPFEELNARYFDFTYSLNVKAFLTLMQALAGKLAPNASVIAVSSEGAVRSIQQYALVGSSKAALESLCRHLAVELAPRGVRVNVLSPGTVNTDAWKVLPNAEERLAKAAEKTPRGRLVTLEEVACAAQFLASDAASGMSGHTLVVDGGARIVGTTV